MDEKQKMVLARIVNEKILFNCEMAQYTTFRVGGRATAVCFPNDLRALRKTVGFLHREEIPYLVVGRGSNLLISDSGFNGTIIILRGSLAYVRQSNTDKRLVSTGAGAGISELISFCVNRGLGGLEFMAGIPGTVGGAVFMNAGAYGKEIGEFITEIHTVSRDGEQKKMRYGEMVFSYRKAPFEEGEIISGVRLQLEEDESESIKTKVSDYMRRRKETQPLELPCAGSVFKNPENDYAGRLIEAAGLKGERIGGAMISPKHANFIVNQGDARARDILDLIDLVRERVKEVSGVDLELEVKVIGN
ncbi:MAG: UDP-N-acetylmuramate dehydrogenase [Deltaproteobacteria bacterium]|nr:UDP-N-acetylmuramate dehydrogenase [Deltaproteobacteria bacterium]